MVGKWEQSSMVVSKVEPKEEEDEDDSPNTQSRIPSKKALRKSNLLRSLTTFL